ncbi:MAG: STAS domain-containing protein, partial [Cyanobacteria bacterium J06650_10]
IKDCDVVVFDLAEVPHLGVTASLTIENAIKEATEKGRHVLLVGPRAQTMRRLKNLDVLKLIPSNHVFDDREAALKYAAHLVSPSIQESPTDVPLNYDPAMG